ncbi:MAG: formylglycine-generating enzyme family protein, partial [Candidatus Electrothrix sp.]
AGEDKPVTQRMRWIPPGRFLMGSPEDEPGRYDDEGPQHQVTISTGFWLFDTPVTQALWQAVTGENPSEFKTPNRPVEQVSWNDCQDFLKEINRKLPGLDLTLPAEAQWEYACRAGSSTALYTGPIKIDDDTAPALDPIAWYRKNSGGETHPIAEKQANDWGLYDMLGNVWEWVADPWHENYDNAPEDGSIWEKEETDKAGVGRVVRGGSWYFRAQYCRSAYRDGRGPGLRDDDLGFRCVRVQPGRVGNISFIQPCSDKKAVALPTLFKLLFVAHPTLNT